MKLALIDGFFSQSVQPSEGAKIALALFLAHYFSGQRENFDFWPLLIKSGILSFIPFMLILKEPDLGSSLVFGSYLVGSTFCLWFQC